MRSRYAGGGTTTPPAPWIGYERRNVFLAKFGDLAFELGHEEIRKLAHAHAGRPPVGIWRREVVYEALDILEMRCAITFAMADRDAEVGRSVVGIPARDDVPSRARAAARVIVMREPDRTIHRTRPGRRIKNMIEPARRDRSERTGKFGRGHVPHVHE